MTIEEKREAYIEYQRQFFDENEMYSLIDQSDQNRVIRAGGYDDIIEEQFEVKLVKKVKPTDFDKYPYKGICGKCSNYADKLDKNCLCQLCYSFGVRKIGVISDEIFKLVKPRF